MATELTLVQLPDTDVLRSEINAIVRQAEGIIVDSPESYSLAGEYVRYIKTRRKKITELFREAKQASDHAHKTIVATEKKEDIPAAQAEMIVKDKMAVWRAEEERKRRAEEQRLRAIAQKEEEDRRLAEAARLEAEGKQQQAEAIIGAPVTAPVVVVPTQVPKVAGVSTTIHWKFRIFDPAMIPPEYMMPDEKKIGAYARSMRAAAQMQGVEFYPKETVAAASY